ncbi:hypothetical protein CDL12_03661 [Handroanthus impetiginosus]|uniref:Plant bHLH transcription factor ACT-like domain-containing protein n=1 Tax=Handroanthus impetiginosus TaxID=429701 RepID=A0A2G9I1H1_9LAMI|nr:hypothetical protein CDL12_03661 [Handroanthus impetiginosus]
MDKTLGVGDAVECIKKLQERVQTLEEQQRQQEEEAAKRQKMESIVVVKRPQVMEVEVEHGQSDHEEQRLPEIEARLYNENILLKIECVKHKGLLVKILSELEKLNLAVVNISVAPFGSLVLDITIVAKYTSP